MTIYLGSDHAGVAHKQRLVDHLEHRGIQAVDLGPFSDSRVDYPDYAHAVALEVLSENTDTLGVLICGSGNGINMTANKHEGIRSALCWTPEIASLARQHNDANILALPARFISEDEAVEVLSAFLDSSFEGGRHDDRVEKIDIDFSEDSEVL
ncbi:MAG: ribose 5-phosphate isomerase B [Flavobacteriales bacterium]